MVVVFLLGPNALTRFSKAENSKSINSVTRSKSKLTESVKSAIDVPSVEKIERIHAHGNHMKPDDLIKILKKIGHSETLIGPMVRSVIENCKTCSHVKNRPRPRKQAPGITRTSLTVNDCVFIDHKKIKTKDRQTSFSLDELNSQNQDSNWELGEVLSIFEPLSRFRL